MSLLIAYRDGDSQESRMIPRIYDDFDDTLEAGLACKKALSEKGHRDVVLFDLSLDERMGDYFGDVAACWDFIKAHEVKDGTHNG